jgi:hypothetical protein
MILLLNFALFLVFLVLIIVMHELAHYLMAKDLGYSCKASFEKGDFVLDFPRMPPSAERKVLLAGVAAGVLVAFSSFLWLGLWGLGLLVISLVGSKHDIGLLWRYRKL